MPLGTPSETYMPEAPVTGPFGGIQSELPLDQIEDIGFADINNLILRKGVAEMRPGYSDLPPTEGPPEQPVGLNDFFDINGLHRQMLWTPTRLFLWNNGWGVGGGPMFTGSPTDFFSSDVIDYRLCFSQGVDPIMYYDGVSAGSVVATGAPVAKYLAEINGHLMAQFTTEGDGPHPNRYRWSGIGDVNDWTSFSSGSNDQLNNLGPGAGVLKLGQYGFGFHVFGLIQIIPTGIGTSPFAFYPMQAAAEGVFAPRSLCKINLRGQDCAIYLGLDNVYLFNQSSLDTIGDAPMEGRKRAGARSRILADVVTVNPQSIFAFVTYSINGQVFKGYWLVVPNRSVWVYNFDEGNWTRFTYGPQMVIGGPFYKANPVIRIIDLVGPIRAQNWNPATLVGINPYPGALLGFSDGELGYVDFTNYSELPALITSGKCIFKNRRLSKTIKKFRLTIQDLGSSTYTVTINNNRGQTQTQTTTIGTGTGDSISQVLTFSISGLRFTYQVSVPAFAPASFIEFAPMYEWGGEQRGGTVDG